MRISSRHEYPAPVERVFALSTDPEFLDSVCRDIGGRDQSVTSSRTGDRAVTRLSVAVATPGPLASLAGARMTVEQEMNWGPAAEDGSREGRLLIRVAGLPFVMDAVARLTPHGAGSSIDYEGTLTVAVPLVGPILEKAAAPFVLESLEAHQRTTDEWLSR